MLDKFLYESLNWLSGITSRISTWAWRLHVKYLRRIQVTKEKGRKYDGISRPTNDKYKENFDRIFGKEIYIEELKKKLTKRMKTTLKRSRINYDE